MSAFFSHSDMDFQSDLVILFGKVSELMSLAQELDIDIDMIKC